jgi:hypothetical protein
MKRLVITCGLLAALMIGLWAVNAAAANFSGTWAIDKGKTTGLQGPMAEADITWVVTQDDKQITIESKVVVGGQERPAQTATYKLDGSETTAEVSGRMPGKATRKAKWMDGGKMLELTQVLNANFQGNDVTITTKEHWELADGGKVLKVHRSQETPRGTQETSFVFNKK